MGAASNAAMAVRASRNVNTAEIDWKRNLAVLSLVQVLSTLGALLIGCFPAALREGTGHDDRRQPEILVGMVFSRYRSLHHDRILVWGSVCRPPSGLKLMLGAPRSTTP